MLQDEEYGEHGRPGMYPIFHEAVSLPAVKDWLGWDEEAGEFRKREELTRFYRLISPSESQDGQTQGPKIASYAEVRELRGILENPEARKVLFDHGKPFVDAAAIAKWGEIARSWKAELAEAVSALESIGVLELKRLSGDDLQLLTKLRDTTAELLRDIVTLKTTNETQPAPSPSLQ